MRVFGRQVVQFAISVRRRAPEVVTLKVTRHPAQAGIHGELTISTGLWIHACAHCCPVRRTNDCGVGLFALFALFDLLGFFGDPVREVLRGC